MNKETASVETGWAACETGLVRQLACDRSMLAGATAKGSLECGHTPQTALLASLSKNEDLNRCVKVM